MYMIHKQQTTDNHTLARRIDDQLIPLTPGVHITEPEQRIAE